MQVEFSQIKSHFQYHSRTLYFEKWRMNKNTLVITVPQLLALFCSSLNARFSMNIGFWIDGLKLIFIAITHFTSIVVGVNSHSVTLFSILKIGYYPVLKCCMTIILYGNGFRWLSFTLFKLKQIFSFFFFSALCIQKARDYFNTEALRNTMKKKG